MAALIIRMGVWMRSTLWLVVVLALAATVLYLVVTNRLDVTCPPERPIVVEDGSCVGTEFFENTGGR
jgi:anti-sigma-K factor RskA